MSFDLLLERVPVEVKLGWYEAERQSLQVLYISVRFTLSGHLQQEPSLDKESLHTTLDYAELMKHVRRVAKLRERKLIETLAADLIAHFKAYESLASLWIRIEKPAALGGDGIAALEVQHHYS